MCWQGFPALLTLLESGLVHKQFSKVISIEQGILTHNVNPSHHVLTALQCILHLLTVLWGELVCHAQGLCLHLCPRRVLGCSSAGQSLVAALQCVELVAQLLCLVQQRQLVWSCMGGCG